LLNGSQSYGIPLKITKQSLRIVTYLCGMNLINLFRNQRAFFVPYSILLLGVVVMQLLYRQGIISLWVNQRHEPWADGLFRSATHLGDGRFCVAVGLGALLWSYRKGSLLLASFAVSGLLSQVVKNTLNEPRPVEYFSGVLSSLHLVPGVELAHWGSFPSGHTTSAFALYTLLACWSTAYFWQAFWLIPAVAVAFSRVYLLQHFLVDVTVGSLLGIFTALYLLVWQTQYFGRKPKRWHEQGLLADLNLKR
jgi:membrane-associated phospholipid phosphatase